MSDPRDRDKSETTGAPLHGLLAEFDEVGPLLAAAEQVRRAGYQKWDAHTPFPVHGLDQAMGIRSTILPWLVLGAGLTGTGVAILLQWWTNAVDYPFLISGKPFFSLPANIPVAFELTVLFAALTTFFGVLGLNRLPELFHPLFKSKRFARATNDRFFIAIEAGDPIFNRQKTEAFLRSLGATAVEEVAGVSARESRIPRPLVLGVALVMVAGLIPFALAVEARVSTSESPRLHVFPDMDSQPKYKAQSANAFFADGRAMRQPVAGTVAVGGLREDSQFFTGKTPNGSWTAAWPDDVEIDAATMRRGRERYGVYCAPCHGLAGSGDGPVHQRAEALQQGTWVQPTSVYASHVVEQPVGELFNTITNGIRNMPGYGAQIQESDRWAIVLYLKALQRRAAAPLRDVPAKDRATLR